MELCLQLFVWQSRLISFSREEGVEGSINQLLFVLCEQTLHGGRKEMVRGLRISGFNLRRDELRESSKGGCSFNRNGPLSLSLSLFLTQT